MQMIQVPPGKDVQTVRIIDVSFTLINYPVSQLISSRFARGESRSILVYQYKRRLLTTNMISPTSEDTLGISPHISSLLL